MTLLSNSEASSPSEGAIRYITLQGPSTDKGLDIKELTECMTENELEEEFADFCDVSSSSTVKAENPEVDRFRKEVSEKAIQLHAHIDPIQSYFIEMLPIILYGPAGKSLLYVSNDGTHKKLDFYTPKSPIGNYGCSFDVFDYISNKINELNILYDATLKPKKWKVLKLGRKIVKGLETIIKDYGDSNTYKDFQENIEILKKGLIDSIQAKSKELNSEAESFRKQKKEIPPLYEYLSTYADSYPRDLIYQSLEEHYGKRLTDCLLSKYIKDPLDTTQRLFYDEVYSLLFVIATNVNREDLAWKYKTMTKDASDARDFDELSTEEVNELLTFFRKSPDGHNLFDYFEIPISLNKNMILNANEIIDTDSSIEEQRRVCETFVYADMESTKLWQTGHITQMSDIQMIDQLNAFLENSFNPELFHSDRYINFLIVASTAIAFFLSFNDKGVEEREHGMRPLLERLNEIKENASDMYKNASHFIEDYRTQWMTLIGKLKDAMLASDYDFTSYYLSLFAHPLQSLANQKKTLEAHRLLRPYEFLARKVAYWNRYYLTNPNFVDQNGKLKDPDTCAHRVGTLYYLSENRKTRLYEVTDIYTENGMVCQISAPYNLEEFIKKKQPIPLKVTFQGTIDNSESTGRDHNVREGAGYDLWAKHQEKLALPLLKQRMEAIKDLHKKCSFDLDFTGHSLGGADAQNAASYLAAELVSRNFNRQWIHKINIHTFNTAGVPFDTIKRFNNNYGKIMELEKKDKAQKIIGIVSHSVVKHDLVSRSAQAKIGNDFKELDRLFIIEVSNSGVYNIFTNHCDYQFSWTDNILPHKYLEMGCNEIDRYLKGATNSWEDLKGHTYEIVKSSPITRIFLGSVSFAALAFFGYQLSLIGEGVKLVGGALMSPGISFIASEGQSYTKDQMRGAMWNVYDGFMQSKSGPQVLEGTG